MSKELAKVGIGNVLVAIQSGTTSIPERITKKSIEESWDDISIERINDLMTKYEAAVRAHGNATMPGPIESIADAENVANEARYLEQIEGMVKRRKEFLKSRVYDSLDKVNVILPEVQSGVVPVSHTKGKVEVDLPDAHVTLARGGGGRADAAVDMVRLEALLGTEKFRDAACTKTHHKRQVIPAHDTYEPSLETLEEALNDGSVTIEELRQVVVTGDLKPVRYTVTVKQK